MMSYQDDLIFGRDKTENIVSCHIKDNKLFIFQEIAGQVVVTERPAFYFYLTGGKLPGAETLKGKQILAYKIISETEERHKEIRDILYKRRIDFFTAYDPVEAMLIHEGITYFKNVKVTDVSILSFDIETSGLIHNKDSRVFCISNTFRKNGKLTKKLFSCDAYLNDKEMFKAWMKWVREMDPSFMIGHNIFGYDFPYIQHCLQLLGLEFNIGRDGSTVAFNDYESNFRKDGSMSYKYNNVKVFGREVIDTFFLSIKYDIATLKYESYGLKQIIKQEGLEKEGRTFVDASKIRDEWKDAAKRKLIKAYALDDSDDALKLFDLMAPSYFYFAQSIPKTFQQIINSATGAQLNAYMVRSYLQAGQSIPKATETAGGFEGAISFGVPGLYKNCFKQDVSSLYPSIMEQWEVYDNKKDPQANFLKTVKYFRAERLKNKQLAKDTGNKYYKDLEQSQKILINSLYGFMGAPGLNFNSPVNAAFVTAKGREILEKAIEFSTGHKVDYWKGKAGIETEGGDDESDDIS